MKHASQGIVCGQEGQSLVEYALILVLVALAAVVGLGAFGNALLNLYDYIVSHFPAV